MKSISRNFVTLLALLALAKEPPEGLGRPVDASPLAVPLHHVLTGPGLAVQTVVDLPAPVKDLYLEIVYFDSDILLAYESAGNTMSCLPSSSCNSPHCGR